MFINALFTPGSSGRVNTCSHLIDRVVVHTQDHALFMSLAVELLHGLEPALGDGNEGAGGGVLRGWTRPSGGGGACCSRGVMDKLGPGCVCTDRRRNRMRAEDKGIARECTQRFRIREGVRGRGSRELHAIETPPQKENPRSYLSRTCNHNSPLVPWRCCLS